MEISSEISIEYSVERRCPYLGGIFAQSSVDVNAVNMYTRTLPANLDISFQLHPETPPFHRIFYRNFIGNWKMALPSLRSHIN